MSLTTLGLVVNKITDDVASHVPYRDSKLTRLLQAKPRLNNPFSPGTASIHAVPRLEGARYHAATSQQARGRAARHELERTAASRAALHRGNAQTARTTDNVGRGIRFAIPWLRTTAAALNEAQGARAADRAGPRRRTARIRSHGCAVAVAFGGRWDAVGCMDKTSVHQDSLGGNSRTTVFCNCSPSSTNVSETLNALYFGSRWEEVPGVAPVPRVTLAHPL